MLAGSIHPAPPARPVCSAPYVAALSRLYTSVGTSTPGKQRRETEGSGATAVQSRTKQLQVAGYLQVTQPSPSISLPCCSAKCAQQPCVDGRQSCGRSGNSALRMRNSVHVVSMGCAAAERPHHAAHSIHPTKQTDIQKTEGLTRPLSE